MPSSRTGTTKYRNNRQTVINQARANGLTHCPGCGTELDHDNPHQPNSAETDHITPHHQGGSDDTTNLRVLCRTCNQARNRKPSEYANHDPNQYPTTRNW